MPVLAEPLTYCNLLLVLTKFQNIPRQASLVAASVLCKVKPLPTAKFSKIMLFFEHKEHCLHPLLVDLVVWMAMKVPKGPASIVQGELLKDSLQQGNESFVLVHFGANPDFRASCFDIYIYRITLTYRGTGILWGSMRMTWPDDALRLPGASWRQLSHRTSQYN